MGGSSVSYSEDMASEKISESIPMASEDSSIVMARKQPQEILKH